MSTPTVVRITAPAPAAVVRVVTPGPPGPTATLTSDPQFIQATAPTVEQLDGSTRYAWWDTSGGNLTLWIEDGTP